MDELYRLQLISTPLPHLNERREAPTMADNLSQFAVCPACYGRLMPPVITCANGHAVCRNCSLNIDSCPTCRSYFTNVENTLLNQILEAMPVPCKYRIYGCAKKMILSKIVEHETVCYFKEETCYICHGKMAYSALNKHCYDYHNTVCNTRVKMLESFRINFNTLQRDTYSLIYLLDLKLYFLMRFFFSEPQILKVMIQYFGKMNEKNEFLCKIEIDQKSPNPNVRSLFAITGFCVPYRYILVDWHRLEKAITLDLNQIFLTGECPNEFIIKFNIFRR